MRFRQKWLVVASLVLGSTISTGCRRPPRLEPRPSGSWKERALTERRSMYTFGVVYDYSRYGDFQSTLGDQKGIRDFSGDDGASGFGAFLEYVFDKRCPWFVGLSYNSNTLRYEQDFDGSNPLLPGRVDGEVRGSFFDFYTGYSLRPFRGITVRPRIGVVYAINRLSYTELTATNRIPFTSTLQTYKTDLGASVEFPLFRRRLGGRFGFDYTTGFKSDDADRNFRLSLGAEYRIFSRY